MPFYNPLLASPVDGAGTGTSSKQAIGKSINCFTIEHKNTYTNRNTASTPSMGRDGVGFWRPLHQAILLLSALLLLLTACNDDAVVFAPTPIPADRSPLRYTHPTGVFTIDLPREWAVFEQLRGDLAAAHFTPPGGNTPTIKAAVALLPQAPELPSELVNRYQRDIRPDANRYTEIDRQMLPDGSWRLTGIRQTIGGTVESLNTFIVITETPSTDENGNTSAYVGVLEVILPQTNEDLLTAEVITNTFSINPTAPLQPGTLSLLASARPTPLEVTNITAWTTPSNVYFITGEVLNIGQQPISEIPVQAILRADDGTELAQAVDTVMGHALPPGQFAPFSLRFGEGRPADATTFSLFLGNADWQPTTAPIIYDVQTLTWTNEPRRVNDRLVVTGTVTNIGRTTATNLLATLTVFDAQNDVIAAAFITLDDETLPPGASTDYEFNLTEFGGEPVNYLVNFQALPAEATTRPETTPEATTESTPED